MSKIVKVSQSDYRLVVQPQGTITLDVGTSPGKVVITGDLIVEGETTTVNTTNLEIEDNIIRLNIGETGAGITEGTSGIEIDRGTLPNAQLLFDESVTHYDRIAGQDIDGTWVFQNENGETSGLQVGTLTIDATRPADLVFDLQNTSRILKIYNSTDYHSRVLADDDIPNRKFVTTYVVSGGVTPGMADVDKIYFKDNPAGPIKTLAQAKTNSLEFYASDLVNPCAIMSAGGVDINEINLKDNVVTSTQLNNLILRAANNNVEADAIFNLTDQISVPAVTSGRTKLYSSNTKGAGKTGLYFAHQRTTDDNSTVEYINDELVAKNRALLFSMIF